eukprot:TRINITY_DN3776_c0_g1_i7.p1 TRINITY_DN3776_c0_g1~~TRINITY_DN3776_c0_g1_i7.p1  ORF type:complete len:1038 (+),score=268.63 TRINITY_DN3776_c0_g1_i7:67-3180(+)
MEWTKGWFIRFGVPDSEAEDYARSFQDSGMIETILFDSTDSAEGFNAILQDSGVTMKRGHMTAVRHGLIKMKSTTEREVLEHGRYKILEEVGEGQFGRVYKALDTKQENKVVAIKKLKMIQDQSSLQIMKELAIMRDLDHPNVMRSIDFFMDHKLNTPVLVMDFYELTLSKYLKGRYDAQLAFSAKELVNLLLQVFTGLAHLDSCNIAHRDVKADNVLVKVEPDEVRLILSDFGTATQYSDTTCLVRTIAGTLIYMAPEIGYHDGEDGEMEINRYDPHLADVYSAGRMIVVLVTGSERALFKMGRVKGTIIANFPNHAIQDEGLMKRVCEWCTYTLPEDRPTADDVVQCLTRYLQDKPWSHLIITPSTPTIPMRSSITEVDEKIELEATVIQEMSILKNDPVIERMEHDRYGITGTIGEGIFATVYEALDTKEENKMVAIKKLKMIHQGIDVGQMMKELAIMKDLDHPNIIKIQDFFLDQHNVPTMVMNCSKMTLSLFMANHVRQDPDGKVHLSPKEQVNLVKQIFDGLAYLKSMKVSHRHIRADNVMVEGSDGKIKLILSDFGTSAQYSDIAVFPKISHRTRGYMAPEIGVAHNAQGIMAWKEYDGHLADVYSAGVLMVTIVMGSDITLFDSYDKEKGPAYCFPRFTGDGGIMKRVCEWCASLLPENRPFAQDVVRCLSRYLDDKPWSHLISTLTPMDTHDLDEPQSFIGSFKSALRFQKETFETKTANKKSGTLYSYGQNHYHMLGYQVDEKEIAEPRKVSIAKKIMQISARAAHCFALTNDGDVYCWGTGSRSQLGIEGVKELILPQKVKFPEKVTQIAAGGHVSVAMTVKDVWMWGDVSIKQECAVPIKMPKMKAGKKIVAGNACFVLLEDDGTLVVWGYRTSSKSFATEKPRRVEIDVRFADVCMGDHHVLALTENGDVYAFGSNDHGELGLGDTQDRLNPVRVPNLNNMTAISALENCSYAMQDSILIRWGRDLESTPSVVEGKWSKMVGDAVISADGSHAMFLTDSSKLLLSSDVIDCRTNQFAYFVIVD